MKKLIFVMRHLRAGGAERAMVNLAKGLHKHGYEIHFYLLKLEGKFLDDIEGEFQVNPIVTNNYLGEKISNSRFIRSDLMRTFLRLGLDPTIAILAHHIKKDQPDLVLSCLWEADIAAGLALKRASLNIPWTAALQSSVSQCLAGAALGSWRVRFSRSLYQNANAVIGCSNWLINDAIQILNLDPAKTHNIFNGVDTQTVAHLIDEPLDRSKFHPSEINLLSIGRLEAVKRLDLLLNAFRIVFQQYPHSHLHILGEGRLDWRACRNDYSW
jgi:glycosyltransferase involved in cell wall biosynthesis